MSGKMAAALVSSRTWGLLLIVWVAMASAQIVNMSYGMMLPDVMAEFGMDYDVAGMIGSVANIATVLITIPVALVSSRFNARYTVPLCAAAVAVGMLLFGRAVNVPMLFLGRLAATVFYNGIATSLVAVKIRQVPRDRISTVNGIENFVQPVGQTIATLCMAQLLTLVGGWRNVYTILGTLMLTMTALWLVLYRDVAEGSAAPEETEGTAIGSLRIALRQKTFWLIALGWPGTVLIWIGTFYYWPSYAQQFLGMTAAQSGLVVSFIPIFSAIASLTSPILANKVGYDKPFIWPWGFLLPIAYFLMLQSDHLVLLCLFSAFAGYGAYCYVPLAYTTLYKLRLPQKEVSIGLAMSMTGTALGSALGSGVVGALITAFDGDIRRALAICCLSPIPFGFPDPLHP